MTKVLRSWFVAIGFLILGAALTVGVSLRTPSKRLVGDLPLVFLWAWERPEDLRFLQGRNAGVAFLAGTITLSADKTEVRPRLQPLLLARGTPLASVIRIESDGATRLTLSRRQVEETARAIVDLGATPQSTIIQIDYDAVTSERPFYRQVLDDLRRRIPPGKFISMTALSSWCSGDPWILDLPVDEVVPMLFQMGPDGAAIRRELERRGDFREEACRQAVGLATNEPWLPLSGRRRHYVFSPTGWSETQAAKVLQEVERRP